MNDNRYSNPALPPPEDRIVVTPASHPHLFGGAVLGPEVLPDGADWVTVDPETGEMAIEPPVIYAAGRRRPGHPGDQLAVRNMFLVRKVQQVVELRIIETEDLTQVHVKKDDPMDGRPCLQIQSVGWQPIAFKEGAVLVGDYETLAYAPGKLDIWFLEDPTMVYDSRYHISAPAGKRKNLSVPGINIPRSDGTFIYLLPGIKPAFVKVDERDNQPGIQQCAAELPVGVTVETLEGPSVVADNQLLVWNKSALANEAKRKVDWFLWKDVPAWVLRGKLVVASPNEGRMEATA